MPAHTIPENALAAAALHQAEPCSQAHKYKQRHSLDTARILAFTRGHVRHPSGICLRVRLMVELFNQLERVAQLAAKEEISPLVMGKRTMKEWALLDHASPSSYKKDLALFKEAMAFASAGSKPKRPSKK